MPAPLPWLQNGNNPLFGPMQYEPNSGSDSPTFANSTNNAQPGGTTPPDPASNAPGASTNDNAPADPANSANNRQPSNPESPDSASNASNAPANDPASAAPVDNANNQPPANAGPADPANNASNAPADDPASAAPVDSANNQPPTNAGPSDSANNASNSPANDATPENPINSAANTQPNDTAVADPTNNAVNTPAADSSGNSTSPMRRAVDAGSELLDQARPIVDQIRPMVADDLKEVWHDNSKEFFFGSDSDESITSRVASKAGEDIRSTAKKIDSDAAGKACNDYAGNGYAGTRNLCQQATDDSISTIEQLRDGVANQIQQIKDTVGRVRNLRKNIIDLWCHEAAELKLCE